MRFSQSQAVHIAFMTAITGVNTASNRLRVETTAGPAYGLINGTTPDVAQYLGLPFAAPPVGDLRWLPPQAPNVSTYIDATVYAPSCPQVRMTSESSPSVQTIDEPEFLISGTTSEDCLYLDVYKPARIPSGKKLPVLVWIFGGAFINGGSHIDYQIASEWIQRTQNLIVVEVNYRLNIFGFPNAAGLNQKDLNLGLLDQRAALEWVRSNIEQFGGDVDKVYMWGQSAGATAVDEYNYAWPDDPIVSGIILHSGGAFSTSGTDDPQQTNFTSVAEHFGCNNKSATAQVDCMRAIEAAKLEAYLGTAEGAALSFTTVIDNRLKFSNYTERALAGNFSKVPAIMGTNADETTSLVSWDSSGPNLTYVSDRTLVQQLCPADTSNKVRYQAGAKTFRYFNTANFTNISPRWWEGAYHVSELPLLFGTSGLYHGENTPFETAVSHHWQDLYVAFMNDPEDALPRLGWPAYRPDGHALEIAHNRKVTQLLDVDILESFCDGVEPAAGAIDAWTHFVDY